MAEIDKEKLRRAIVNRGLVVPRVEYSDGSQGWGVPGLLMEPWEAMQRLQAGASDEVGRMTSGQPFSKEAIADALTVGGSAALGGVASPKPAGAYVTSGVREGISDVHPASKNASIFDPPKRDLRAFEADYPNGARADEAGRLTYDIDGNPINRDATVVGRRVVGGQDEALSPAEYDALSEALFGNRIARVAAREMGGDAGRFKVSHDVDGATIYQPYVSDSVAATQAPRVAAHEIAHGIDYLARDIPANGIKKELWDNYHRLNDDTWRRLKEPERKYQTRPEDFGYKGGDIDREYMAEAIRAYMADPNYMKSAAPDTAKRIRKYWNTDSERTKILHFNANPKEAAALNAAIQGERDDKLIDIVKKYGIAGAASLYGVSEMELMEAMQERGL